jgi:SulP family sulfate permease
VSDASRFSVVVISLRGKEDLGSTFINVVTRYARRLRDVEGALMLAGVSEGVARQLEKTGAISVLGRGNVFHATPAVTESTRRAVDAAQRVVSQASHTASGETRDDESRPRPQPGGAPPDRRGEQS